MIELEIYKSNVDIIDKFDVKDIKINKGVVYTGNTDYINEQIKEHEHNSPLLAAAILGLDNTGAPIPEDSKFCDIWTDIDAQEIHLNTKPTCYLIFGKAGAGAFSLGEALSKKLNCIHLSPKSILIDEISQDSTTGRTLDFNMRHNKVCLFDTILAMLKIKLNSPAVQHRGYVISDLPLVTSSRNPIYLMNSLHSEEAFLEIDEMLFDTICNLKKKKPKKPPESTRSPTSSELFIPEEHQEEEEEEEKHVEDQQDEEVVEEEENKPAELPKFVLDFCSNIIKHKKTYFKTKQAVLLYQLQEIFNLCLPPDIIIHITCPDLDLIKLRSRRYINYKTGQNNVDPLVSNYVQDLSWPSKYHVSDYENPHDSRVFQPKYNCKPPIYLEDRAKEQVCNYKRYVFPFMQKKFKDFDPKMVIELDGRTSVQQMLHHVTERLILLPIQPAIIPEPLDLEEPPEDLQEFWAIVRDLKVIRSGVVNFKYYASPWFNRCPVELKLRRSVAGIPKYGVMYFKHVYLMSSLNNFISFCRNPRPYLKLKYLEPTCRVIVTGTKSSGKSMVSQCLSWIFDTPITTFQTFLETNKGKKYDTFAKSILSEIIATLEDARFLEWQRTELDRVTKLNKWCNSVLQLLNKYMPLLLESIEYNKKKAEAIPEKNQEEETQEKEEMKGEDEEIEGLKKELNLENEELKEKAVEKVKKDIDPTFLTKFNALRTQLSFLPILDSVDECKMALANRDVSQYAPIELTTVRNKPLIPVMGDEDVTIAISKYIVANDLQKELEPSTEEVMTEMVKFITSIDTQTQKETHLEHLYGKYIIDGFPSDSEYWGYISDPKLFPDYTIALIENREIDQELYKYYANCEKYTKHYGQTILLAKDPLIETRLLASKLDSDNLQDFDMQIIVNDLINDSLDFLFITRLDTIPSQTNLQTQFITSFTEAVEKFREDWDNVKLKLEEKSKSYIEIELENKTYVNIIEEMLLKLRQSYCSMGETNEDEETEVSGEDADEIAPKDLLTYNDPQFLCETNIYCPIAYYDYNILWEGKPEFSLKHDNKMHYFCKEEFLELFRKNITKYQFYNRPYKKIPKLKICVTGAVGCGATTLAKHLAKELGLLHIDFADIINYYMMPRHYKSVGREHENIFADDPLDEEAVVEFQMNEENANVASDILANEVEMRRMVNNHFERGAPILSTLIQKMITKIWFDPFVPTGFVLDGYPRLPTDVDDMLASYAIPDMLIIMQNTSEDTVNRLVPVMVKSWKSQQDEAKKAAKIKLNNERKLWMHNITKKVVVKLIMEEVLENVFESQTVPIKSHSTESVIMDAHPTGSANVDPILYNTYKEMVQEYPEPKDLNVWEKIDEARERLEARIEGIFEIDDENLRSLMDLVMEQKIKTVTVDGTKSIHKITRYVLSKLSILKNRCESFFEQTFIVTPDIAEMLLLRGFYFFSKFNRLCPVYLFENPLTILNSYKISRRKGTIFPVIHRSYIYFISSKDNVIKFRTNPLKYITSDVIKSYFEYPLRIGVIGTPKCGKSTLAAKLAEENGLLCISRGKAVRSVLENMHWTELASLLTNDLKEGKTIDADHIVKAVQTLAIDHRTVTYGFVFDGFPLLPYVAKGLVKNGLYPNIIFDVSTDRSKILENSQREIYYDILKHMPPYSYPLIAYKYDNWKEKRYQIRSWITDDYQNLCLLDGSQSRWDVLQQANGHLEQLTSKIHFYVSHVEKGIVRAMWISNEAFEQRQTQYKIFCPVCFHKRVYRHMGDMGHPDDKKGVVQYKNNFYWICEEHLDMVMTFPHCYLTPREIEIPEIPVIIKIVNVDYVYENGICLVTYAENLPAQKIVMGTNEFAASYAARRVPVPDERFDYLCEYHKPASKVPAFLNVVDIAGLVRGAAEGQGLGNAFLSHIKACDAIFNLCRAFDDEDVIHVDGEVNPVRDLETIGEELRLKDEEQLVQNFDKLDKVVSRGGDKKLKPEYDSLSRIKAVLVDEKKHIRFGDWSAADIEVLNKYLFLTSKPALYLVNLSEKDYIRKKNKWLPKLKEWIDKNDPGAPLIPFSGVLEMKLFEMDPAEKQAFLKEHNITSALDKIIVQGYKALQLEYFFTAGPDEVKAWTIQKGTKAPQAAGRIHTDFEKGFIMAEVMHYKDFKEEGTEAACKAAGKYRQQGRNYVVEDGDIIFFKFNAGAGLKDAKKK